VRVASVVLFSHSPIAHPFVKVDFSHTRDFRGKLKCHAAAYGLISVFQAAQKKWRLLQKVFTFVSDYSLFT
jgi:hypothetical protein